MRDAIDDGSGIDDLAEGRMSRRSLLAGIGAAGALGAAATIASPAHAALAGFASLFRSEGIGALAFIPLVSEGRLVGKFMLYHGQPHTYASHEVEAARAIANHLASVITRFSVVAELEGLTA